MKRRALIVAVCLVAVAACGRAYAISTEADTIRDLTNVFPRPSQFPPNNALRPQINGNGNEYGRRTLEPLGPDLGPGPEQTPERVPLGAYPFVVGLVDGSRTVQQGYVCAGTLIAPHWVVTAAHCTYGWTHRWPVDPEAYVLTGTTRLSEPGPRYPVTAVIPHPDYDAHTLANDIALVRIDTKGARIATPLKVDGPPVNTQIGKIAHIVGWGVTNLTLLQRQKTESLQLIQAVVRGEGCFAAGNYPRLRGTGVFCARSLYRYHDTCYRFGGAPLVMRDDEGVRYLGGLVSWSSGCPPEADKMNVYLDVQRYVPWIRRVLAAHGSALP